MGIQSISSPFNLLDPAPTLAPAEAVIVSLTSTSIIAIFSASSDAYKGRVVLYTLVNSAWVISDTEYLIAGGATFTYMAATKMTDTTALVTFRDASSSNKGKVILVTASSGALSLSASAYLIAGGTGNHSMTVTRMTDTTATLAFADEGDSDKGKVILVTVSNGAVSCSTPAYLTAGGTTNLEMAIARITDTMSIVAFRNVTNSHKGQVVLVTVAGGEVSCSDPAYLMTGGIPNWELAATGMTSTTALVVFQDSNDNYKGKAVVVSVSGNSVSCSSPTYLVESGTANGNIATTKITDTTALIAFNDASVTKGRAVLCTINGSTIDSMSSPVYLVQPSGSANSYMSATTVSAVSIAVLLRDEGDSGKGKFVIVSLAPPTVGYLDVTVKSHGKTTVVEFSSRSGATKYNVHVNSKSVLLIEDGATFEAGVNLRDGLVSLVKVKAKDDNDLLVDDTTILVTSIPAPITGVELVSQASTSAVISWDRLNSSVNALTGIKVYIKNMGTQVETSTTYAMEDLPDDKTVEVTGLTAGVLYNLRVRGYNDSGESPDSAIVVVQM